MDLSRLKNITDKDLKRYEKYKKALEILENYKGWRKIAWVFHHVYGHIHT